jgi:membrane protease YdiL (CAAX protease family)
MIPDLVKFQGEIFTSNDANLYLTQDYGVFLISVLIIQVCVAIYEETLIRGFVTKRAAEHFNKLSAVFVSAFYFGLMHFAYILNPISRNYSFWFPIIWFSQAFLVGIILAFFIIKKKWILPLIMAHAINNIISAHAVWNYLQGNSIFLVFISLYIPLLVISIVLILWQFSRVKESVSDGLKEIKKYFQKDTKKEQDAGDVFIRILFDIILGFLIFGVGLFFV